MNLTDVLDGSFKLFVANWRTIVVAAGALLVPIQLASAWLQRDLPGFADMVDAFSDPAAAEQLGATGGDLTVLLAIVEGLLVSPLVTGVVAGVGAASYLGGRVEPAEALGAGLRRWAALVAAGLLTLLAVFLPLLVAVALVAGAAGLGAPVAVVVLLGVVAGLGAVVGGLALASLFAGTIPAVVVERLGPLQAMRRSATLLRPRLPAVAGALVVALLLVAVLSMALGGIPQLAAFLLGDPYGWLLLAVGYIASGLVTTPLLALVLTLLYFDGRVRQEALDLRLVADGLSGGDGNPPGGSAGG